MIHLYRWDSIITSLWFGERKADVKKCCHHSVHVHWNSLLTNQWYTVSVLKSSWIPQQSSAYLYSILIHIAWGEIETKPFWENYPMSYPRTRCLQGPFFCLHLHCQQENWSEKGQLADSIAKSLLCNILQQHWRTFVHILFTCFLSSNLYVFKLVKYWRFGLEGLAGH